jgi:hypothetical protein
MRGRHGRRPASCAQLAEALDECRQWHSPIAFHVGVPVERLEGAARAVANDDLGALEQGGRLVEEVRSAHRAGDTPGEALVRQPVKPLPEPVARVAALMETFEPTWSLCGGWAVDAWVGRQTRDHNDVDVAVFRDDERAIFDHLADWHLSAHDTPDATHSDRWDGRALDFPAHIHARLDDGLEWEVQLNERSGDDWIVNRQPRIAIPVARFSLRSPHGLPTMAPEVLLWYKAADVRPHDELDFVALLPVLTDEQRRWLRGQISVVHPAHPWPARIAEFRPLGG